MRFFRKNVTAEWNQFAFPSVFAVIGCAFFAFICLEANAAILSSKRGLGDVGANYNNLQAVGAGWYYTWGTGDANPGNFDANHYPMFWSGPSQTTINNTLAAEPTYILGFNEPERSDQANMSVSQAISAWTTISNSTVAYNSANGTNIKLVSPAVADTGGATGGQQWLANFMSQANSNGLKVDAVAFHWYGVSTPSNPSGAASSFLSRVDSYHNSYNKPVFVTEFAIHDWGGNYTDAEIIEANRQFLNIVIPGLESRSYVAGYAWYNWFSDSPLYNSGNFEPTVMGYDYVGAVQSGSTANIGGVNLGEHIAYINGGEVTMTGSPGQVKFLEALYDPNVSTNTSVISGSIDWVPTNWTKIQSGATLRKSGSNSVSFTAGTLTNSGVLEVADGVLRLGIVPSGNGSLSIFSTGGATGSTGRLELTGNINITQPVTFLPRNDPGQSDGIRNVSGNNTLSGGLTIGVGGNQTRIQSDAGQLTLSGAVTTTATSARNLYFQGVGNGVVSGVISDNASDPNGKINVAKEGAGTWTLSGANTYTGTTTVSGGTLVLKHSGSTSGVTIAAGATLRARGGISNSGGLTIAGTLDVAEGSISTISATTANLTSTVLNMDVGNGTASDRINASGAATVAGTNTVNVSAALGQSASPGSSYTLIAAASGLNAANFALGTKPASMGFTQLSLSTPTPSALVLMATGNAIPGVAYWTGDGSTASGDAANNWGAGSSINDSNWSTDAAGTIDPQQLPGATTSVIFTAANASGSSGTMMSQLDSSYSVQGLTFDVPAAPGITSTILNTNGNSLVVGNSGLSLATTSNSSTIITGSGSVLVNGDQFWSNNNNAQSLTISSAMGALSGATQLSFAGTGTGGIILSGPVGDGGGTLSTYFNQAGTTTLSAANTYTGTTTVAGNIVEITSTGRIAGNAVIASGGTLRLSGGTDGIADSSGVNVQAGGTFDVRAASAGGAKTETIAALSGNGVVTRGNSGTTTLTVGGGNQSSTFSGSIQNGSGIVVLAKTGTGTLTLTGTNTYTGGTTINDGGGALLVTSNNALGNGNVTIGNGGSNQAGVLQFSGGLTTSSVPTISFSSRSLSNSGGSAAIENVSGNNSLSANFNINNTGGSAANILSTAGTLTLTGNMTSTGLSSPRGFNFYGAGNGVASGIISNGSAQPTFVQKDGTGTWTLSGNNTFTGDTTVNAGTLILSGNNNFGGGGVNVNGGTAILSGNNTYTGGTVIDSGTTVMGHPFGLGSASSGVTLSGGGTLVVDTDGGDRAYNLNVGSNNTVNVVSGVKTGAVGINHTLGTLSVGVNDTVNVHADTDVTSGNPSITLGNITLSSGVGAGSSTFNPTTAKITIGAVTTSTNSAKTLVLDGTNTGNTVSGAISNGANVVSVTKSNSSTWTLSASSTYSGGTQIGTNNGAGVLRATANNALGTGAIDFDGSGGATGPTSRLELSGGISLTNPTITLNQRNNTSVAIESVSGNNTMSGAISLSSGGNQARIQSDANTLILSGGISAASSTRTLTLQGAGNGIASGLISNGGGAISIAKEGTGTWTLSNINTYTGTTTVSTGTLLVNGRTGTGLTTVASGATLGGSGTVAGDLSLSGDLAPGNSAGIISVTGNASFALGSSLTIEIGGIAIGSGYDHLNVSAQLALAGTLNVVLINGFVPTLGASFDLFDRGSIVGTFSNVTLPTIPNLQWDTTQLYVDGSVKLISALPGDFDGNGTVESADFVIWRKANGSQIQFDTWRSHFGQSVGSGFLGKSAIPEPAGVILFCIGMASIVISRRRG
jgi:autotransporter-associated beta strand protein